MCETIGSVSARALLVDATLLMYVTVFLVCLAPSSKKKGLSFASNVIHAPAGTLYCYGCAM